MLKHYLFVFVFILYFFNIYFREGLWKSHRIDFETNAVTFIHEGKYHEISARFENHTLFSWKHFVDFDDSLWNKRREEEIVRWTLELILQGVTLSEFIWLMVGITTVAHRCRFHTTQICTQIYHLNSNPKNIWMEK
jgi:hypothetical protein